MRIKPILSIIVPCFNCEDTVKETVESLYSESLNVPFETIFVNDGSTDGTAKLLSQFKSSYSNSRIFTHENNKGGGAARNTGIQAAKGRLIFCLDSDNILIPSSISKMIAFLDEEKLDGVAFHKRHFFIGSHRSIGSVHTNPVRDSSFTLENVFDGSGILLDNFLCTKKAVLQAGGYPENHGFDTQAFEVRYLSKGLSVRTCPDTHSYHRQRAKNRSYFERVYEDGEQSRNYYLIFEEIFHLFSRKVQQHIIEFDIFTNNTLQNDLFSSLCREFKRDRKSFFASKEKKPKKSVGDIWSKAVEDFTHGRYSQAIEKYESLQKDGINSKILYWNILRNLTAMRSDVNAVDIEKEVDRIISQLRFVLQKSMLRKPIVTLALSRLGRSITALKI
ncbi:MAG TPA: glycosyltransferase family 2 protein [Patescibacteria group bacterium]|nr:glycosyltransferase family 2 protein [Patescibacteria group bacterium]